MNKAYRLHDLAKTMREQGRNASADIYEKAAATCIVMETRRVVAENIRRMRQASKENQ